MFKNAQYIKSAVSPEQYPFLDDETLASLPQFAFFGRSNVGKSSFINSLLNRNNLAYTSKTPGKTATLNFYLVDHRFWLVDVPGYGYAIRSNDEKRAFEKMINLYFETCNPICCQLVDFKVGPTQDDCLLWEELVKKNYQTLLIATKIDKVKKNDYIKQKKIIMEKCPHNPDDLYLVSNLNKSGFEEIRARFEKEIEEYE